MTDIDQTDLTRDVPVHFIKSAHFRVVLMDGAFGGVTPHGRIQTAFYTERSSFPRRGIAHIQADGSSIEEITESDNGFTREIDVAVSMGLQHAKSYHQWLGEKIAELEGALTARLANGMDPLDVA